MPLANASGATLPPPPHGSGSGWLATPFLHDSFIHGAWHVRLLGGLLGKLKGIQASEGSLLDRSMVLYGSNFGDANKHTTTNMPVILAGGGFKHGQHLAFDANRNYPLPNLFVSMLQRMGIETDRFATSTGSMRGLELKS